MLASTRPTDILFVLYGAGFAIGAGILGLNTMGTLIVVTSDMVRAFIRGVPFVVMVGGLT